MKALMQHSGWAITVPLIVAAAAYFFLSYWPGRQELQALRQQLAATQATIKDAGALAARIPAVQRQLDESSDYAEQWLARIPEVDSVVRVFGDISEAAKEAGATPSRFAPSPIREQKFIRRIPLELQCSGSFQDIREFLHELESLPQVIWIDELQLEPMGKDRELAKCELKLVLFGRQSEISD